MTNAFNPQLITDPRLNPMAAINQQPQQVAPLPTMEQISPVQPVQQAPAPAPAPAPQQVFIPVPIKVPVPTPTKSLNVSPDAARKAQGIYPAEQQAKQAQMNNAKAPPSPTGAWGSPQ